MLLLSGCGAACNHKHRGRSWPTSCSKHHLTTGGGPSTQPWWRTSVHSHCWFDSQYVAPLVFYVWQLLCLSSSSSFFSFCGFDVEPSGPHQTRRVKEGARPLSAPRYRALFTRESVLCLKAITYLLWGSCKTTLRKCVCIVCISHQRGVRRPRALCLMRPLLMDSWRNRS